MTFIETTNSNKTLKNLLGGTKREERERGQKERKKKKERKRKRKYKI